MKSINICRFSIIHSVTGFLIDNLQGAMASPFSQTGYGLFWFTETVNSFWFSSLGIEPASPGSHPLSLMAIAPKSLRFGNIFQENSSLDLRVLTNNWLILEPNSTRQSCFFLIIIIIFKSTPTSLPPTPSFEHQDSYPVFYPINASSKKYHQQQHINTEIIGGNNSHRLHVHFHYSVGSL